MSESEHELTVEDKENAMEAILFAMGNAVELSSISGALGIPEAEAEELLDGLSMKYDREKRGIQIIRLENSYQMCTRKDYFRYLIHIAAHPKKPELTEVMLETLSIIAYKQPVTKAEVEKIRGLRCDHVINRLIDFRLVRELGRLNAPGRPILFGTTEEFLRTFGVQALDDLPEPDPVKVADFKAEAEEEIRIGT